MKIIDQANDIALESLYPGPAAFLHRYLWDKIHSVHVSHSRRGVAGSEMAIVPEMMIKDVHNKIKTYTANRWMDLTPKKRRSSSIHSVTWRLYDNDRM